MNQIPCKDVLEMPGFFVDLDVSLKTHQIFLCSLEVTIFLE